VEVTIFRHCALAEPFFPPLYVQGLDAEGRPVGNLHLKNFTVRDDRDRPILKIRDRKGNGVKEFTGEILLERNGQSTSIVIDDAWLETMCEYARAVTAAHTPSHSSVGPLRHPWVRLIRSTHVFATACRTYLFRTGGLFMPAPSPNMAHG
jgi:hypothetical protein